MEEVGFFFDLFLYYDKYSTCLVSLTAMANEGV